MKNLSVTAKEKAGKIGEAIIAAMQATSVQFAASYKGEIIASGSVGKYDLKESRPLSNQDMYGVGSTSKMFVTAAAMLLVDQGKLDIDKPFKDYVPDFEMADPRYTKITSRHLMNHSSGIYGTHFKGGFLFEDNSTFAHDNLLEFLKVCTLKYDPGTFSEYCNDGFQLLEILVERLSGLGYNQFLEKYFFAPMGIKNTKTPQDKYDRNQMAKYSMPPIYDGDLPYETTNLIGTGGVVSTAEDLCAFGQILMGKKILSEKSAKLMAAKEYATNAFWPKDDEPNNLFAYGLGYDHVHVPPFDKVGYAALCKGGDTMQYHASLIVIPELDLAAASLSAGAASFANYLLVIELLKAACLEFELVKEFPAEKTFAAPVKQEMPAELKRFEGLYAENGKFAEIVIKDGEIEMGDFLGGMIPAQKYTYAGEGKFVSPDGKNAIHFAEVPGGLTFLQGDLMIDIPGVGAIQWKAYLHQKLEKNPLDAKVAAAWEARKDKKFMSVNDMPTSMSFLSPSEPSVMTMTVNTEYGYALGGAKILDENNAKSVLYARDVMDINLFQENGMEYYKGAGNIYINSACIPTLAADATAVTIGANGYTQYFKVDEAAAGKTLTVKLPANAAFAAYTQADPAAQPPKSPLKLLTTVTGNKPVVLEKDDTLAFIAAAGDTFGIELK